MKAKILVLALAILPMLATPSARAQGTAFTYQGQLQSGIAPANGKYDFTFNLFTTNTGGTAITTPITNTATPVSNGLFTVAIDFGPTVWNGTINWLEISVRSNKTGSFVTLTPRQQLTPTPYAIFAASSSASGLIGSISTTQLASGPSNNFFASAGPVNPASVGSFNTTFGIQDLVSNTTGAGNTAVGFQALFSNANGSNNTAVGAQAMFLNTSGFFNTALGLQTLFHNTTGAENTAVGYQAIFFNTNGSNNTGLGFAALVNNTSGSQDTALGTQALSSNTNGNDNTGVGYAALFNNTSGTQNTGVGYGALFGNVTGNNNTASGVEALLSNTNGSGNAAYGFHSLEENLSGGSNTAYGIGTLLGNVNANNNVAVGFQSLRNVTNGNGNIALGFQAGINFTGNESSNIDIGNEGVVGDNNIIRIGTPGIQTSAIIAGVISSDGSQLTNLNANNISSGTVPGSVLPANVAILNSTQTFTAINTFTNGFIVKTGAGSITITNDGTQAAGIIAAGGSNPGDIRLRNYLQVFPNIAGTTGGTLDVRNTGGSPTIILNGANGNVSATTFSGDGSSLINLNASALAGGVVPTNVLPGFQAPDFNVIGGGSNNSTAGFFAVIAGGQKNQISGDPSNLGNSTISGGRQNIIGFNSPFSSIGGGVLNLITNATGCTISGGSQNKIIAADLDTGGSFIGGGILNVINGNVSASVIGGGSGNQIFGDVNDNGQSVVAGGSANHILFNANFSFIGGGFQNQISGDSQDAGGNVIAGGDQNVIATNAPASFVGGGISNSIIGDDLDFGGNVIAGGTENRINTNASGSFIGGGANNQIFGDQNDNGESVIAGGNANEIFGNAGFSVITGGTGNQIFGDTGDRGASVIGGGAGNTINTNAPNAAIGGGLNNSASSEYATVPGGNGNNAAGRGSFAAGINASAVNGCFVWGDGSVGTAANIANQFVARASGGVIFYSAANNTSGVSLAAGGGSWNSLSDRNSKNDLSPINSRDVLTGVLSLPITQWSYKTEQGVRHLGPMAQDFHAAFQIGENDTTINTIDEEGVALAAIQGLNQKVETENAALRSENAALKKQFVANETEMEQLRQSIAQLKTLLTSH